MLVRLDAGRFTDEAGMHAELADALGFPEFYGRNLNALVDCLSYLDQPGSEMARVFVFPGQVLLLVLDGVGEAQMPQVRTLADVVAFVNWRRVETGDPPVLALAYNTPV